MCLLCFCGVCRAKYYDDSEDDFSDDAGSEDLDVMDDDDVDEDDDVGLPNVDVAEISSDESEDSYDAELYRDDEDRASLARMTDIERQAILYERGEKRNQIRERNSLKAQLRAARGLPAVSKHRKEAGVSRGRGGRAKTSAAATAAVPRPRVSGKKAALDEIKEKRKASAENATRARRKRDEDEDNDYDPDAVASKPSAQRQQQAAKEVKESARATKARLEVEAKLQKLRDRHRISSDDEDDPSNHEILYDEFGKRIVLTGEVNYQDMLKMMVKRDELAKWHDTPNWEKTIKGCFVRISVGTNESGEPIYKLAEILDFNPEGKSYTMPSISTDKYSHARTLTTTLNLAIGGTTKDFTMDIVSNRPLSEQEFDDWAAAVRSQQLALPSKKTSLIVAKQLTSARTCVRTDADIDREIKKREEERAQMQQRMDSANPATSPAFKDKHAEMVLQINKRNRGVNASVESATTALDLAGDVVSHAANNSNSATSTSTIASNGSHSSSSSSSSLSLDLDDGSRHSHHSNHSQGYRSSHDHRQQPHSRGAAAPVAATPTLGAPSRVMSLSQYLNRKY